MSFWIGLPSCRAIPPCCSHCGRCYWFSWSRCGWLLKLKSSSLPLSLSPLPLLLSHNEALWHESFTQAVIDRQSLTALIDDNHNVPEWVKEKFCNPLHFVGKSQGFLLPWPSNHFWSCYICSWNTSILITQWYFCSKKMWTCHLVGGLEHEFYDFPFSCEVHHPNCHRIGWWENLQENPSNLMVKTMVSG